MAAAPAAAHGRPPSLQWLVFDPGDPDRIAAQATWGMAFSDDGGLTWSWSCAAAYGVDARMEDPPLARAADGRLVAGTYGGVFQDDDGRGCQWESPAPVGALLATDLQPDGRDGLLLVASDGSGEDRLWRRAGGSWEPHSEGIATILIDRVRVAPSNPDTLYVSGQRPRRADQERGLFAFRSTDGGRTFDRRTEVGLRGEEYGLQVVAVAPQNPDVVLAVVLNFDGEAAPERLLRSTDGIATFQTRLTIPQVGGVVVFGEGDTILAGSKLGGLWRSEDGGDAWTRVQDVAVRCLHVRGDELWVCTDQGRDGMALAMSRDRGDTLEPVLRLPDLLPMRSCATCSDVSTVCPAWTPDVAFDLGLDYDALGIDPPAFDLDGGVGLPREPPLPEACGGPPERNEPGGCGCSTPGPVGGSWLLLPLLWAHSRRRMNTKPKSARSAPPVADPDAT